jgi:hypothetical protein
MSDEPRTDCTKIAPQLLGIVALAALFIAFIQSDHAPESHFRQAARRLRIGMTFEEASAALDLGGISGAASSPHHWDPFWFDETRDEVLFLHFKTTGSVRAGTSIDRLATWRVERADRVQ